MLSIPSSHQLKLFFKKIKELAPFSGGEGRNSKSTSTQNVDIWSTLSITNICLAFLHFIWTCLLSLSFICFVFLRKGKLNNTEPCRGNPFPFKWRPPNWFHQYLNNQKNKTKMSAAEQARRLVERYHVTAVLNISGGLVVT